MLYTPAFNRWGTDTFQYTVTDSNEIISAPATVTVNVTFVAQGTVATDGTAATDEYSRHGERAGQRHGLRLDLGAWVGNGYRRSPEWVGRGECQRHDHLHSQRQITGADQLTYTVKDALGLTSNPATLDLHIEAPVSLSGVVYVDTNNNGVQDSGEVGVGGVTVTLTKTSGPVTFSMSTTTAADGSYSFAESAGFKPAVAGTYTLTETSPIYFVDGKDTPGATCGHE